MGIPLLFGYLARKYRKTKLLRDYNPENQVIDNLYLDYNGLIHNVLNELSSESLTDAELCDRIFRDTVKLYKLVKPRKLLYIAIDGVAPRAKMNQQRMRRFKSVLRTEGTELDGFDRNKVTPGTEFMDELSKYLHERFEEISGVNVIFSDVNEEGEGEHKIMDYIRDNKESLKDEVNVINGLDCDLVMLTLSVDVNFRLLRENNKGNGYVIFDVREMKDLILEDIQTSVGFKLDKQRVIIDFIVISFLLGNDFLMNLPTLKIKQNGLHILLTNYAKLYRSRVLNSRKYLVKENFEIDRSALQKYFQLIGGSEDYYIKQHCGGDPVEFRRNYYKTYLKTESEEYIKSMSMVYIEGIQWVTEYYLKGVRDWRWYYPHYYSPFANDIAKTYFKSTEFEYKQPYTPEQQLVSVLPLKSLPEKYNKRVTSEIMYMFPDKFEIDNRDPNIPEHARNALIPFVEPDVLFGVMLKNTESP
jgi:5'-3' exonuclease